MFDISWGKLIIIGVVALLVIGPKELPAVLRQLGQWMTKIRRMAAEFQGQFQDAMREAEMAELKKTFDETTSGLTSVFDPIKNDMDKMVNDPMSMGSSSTAATPDAGIPTPGAATDPSAPVDPVALGTAPVAPAEISVPMPELPPPVETKDFAAPASATPAPDLAQADVPAAAPAAGAAAPESAPAPEAGGGKAA
jgi:sec-independent protein translocase protein TatB